MLAVVRGVRRVLGMDREPPNLSRHDRNVERLRAARMRLRRTRRIIRYRGTGNPVEDAVRGHAPRPRGSTR